MMEEPLSAFALDAETLHVAFTASLGSFRVRGTFRVLSGSLQFGGGDLERAAVVVDVAAGSIDTGFPMRDRHLRGPSFLDASRHPAITFRSTRVQRDGDDLVVAGILTLRGIPREIVTRCPIVPPADESEGGTIALCGALHLPIRRHGVGVPRGLDVFNPIFLAVGRRVTVSVRLVLPAMRIPPALRPALGR